MAHSFPIPALLQRPAPVLAHTASQLQLGRGTYQLRFAETREDLEAAFRLRFQVFNLELNEGLQTSYRTGRDSDEFDDVCDHLIVEHRTSEQVVGTYRLQTGKMAGKGFGYYSAREFDFSPYEAIRDSLVELAVRRFTQIIARSRFLRCYGAALPAMRRKEERAT